MKKKTIGIIIGALVLVVAINTAVITVLATDNVKKIDNSGATAFKAEWVDREDVDQSMVLTVESEGDGQKIEADNKANKIEKKLTYDQSRKVADEAVIDVYKDENGVEYRYEGERLMGFYDSKVTSYDKTDTPVSEKEAIEIAKKHIKELYNEDMEGYVLDEIHYNSGQRPWIVFRMKYGKNDFVNGPTILVAVAENGTVFHSSMPCDRFLGFDEALLNGITEETLKEWAKETMEEKYGEGFEDYWIQGAYVERIDGKFCLHFEAVAEVELFYGGINDIWEEETDFTYSLQ